MADPLTACGSGCDLPEELLRLLRLGGPVLLRELEIDDGAHEQLLGAVVQVAGDPLACRVEP